MFDAIDTKASLDKAAFKANVERLRAELVKAQVALKDSNRYGIVLISGFESSGKAEVMNRLGNWLDLRSVDFHALGPPTDEEKARPWWWRFWRRLPKRGRIGFFLGGWTTEVIQDRVSDELKRSAFERRLHQVRRFEEMLVEDGAVFVKFWLHLSEKQQKKRLQQLDDDRQTTWRVTKEDWRRHKSYNKIRETAETAVQATHSTIAPWILIGADDERYRDVTAADALVAGLNAPPVLERQNNLMPLPSGDGPLAQVDLTAKIDRETYDKKLPKLQAKIGRIARKRFRKGRSTVLVFEGWDAAGKGGSIRRLAASLDARSIRVTRIGAPSSDELAHHYLWRFWRSVPRDGHVTIYDRSWYGRVMVERIEGFATQSQWRRSYEEINDFEEQLVDQGALLLKFFIHLSKAEQLRRFEDRKDTPYKRHKITDEDWRNREKWDEYEAAINEMLHRTDTKNAPWIVVPGDDKPYARIKVLSETLKAMKASNS